MSFPDRLNGTLGQYHRLRDEDDVIFNDEPEANGYRHAYLFTLVRKGHEGCGCMKSIWLRYYNIHGSRGGVWPRHYRGTVMLGKELAGLLGDLLGDEFQLSIDSYSYVLVRIADGRTVLE